MTTLETIIHWAESDMSAWQSDAVRRLLSQDVLTDNDKNDILCMLKAGADRKDVKNTVPTPTPISAGPFPVLRWRVQLRVVRSDDSV